MNDDVNWTRTIWLSALYTCPICGEFLTTDGKVVWCGTGWLSKHCIYGVEAEVTVQQHKATFS